MKTETKKIIPASAISFSLLVHLAIFLSVSGFIITHELPPKIIPISDPAGQFIPTTLSPPPVEPPEPVEPEFPADRQPAEPSAASLQTIFTPDPAMPQLIQTGGMITTVSGNGLPAQLTEPPRDEPANRPKNPSPIVSDAFTHFGSLTTVSGLTGRMYDLKQTADRKPSDLAGLGGTGDWNSPVERKANDGAALLLTKFIAGNWNPALLEKYYRFEKPVHAPQIFIPPLADVEAPKAFGAERVIQPRRWIIHYTGQFTAPVSGVYRFAGHGDDYLAVRLGNKTVLDGSLHRLTQNPDLREPLTKGAKAQQTLYGGAWFTLSAGQTYPVEILIGEQPGGVVYAFLLLQKKNEKYPPRQNNPDFGPVLPVVQFAPASLPKYQPETNGPTVAKEFITSK